MSELASIILGLVGVLLSLVYSLYPPAKAWLASKGDKQGLWMFGITFVVAAVYFGIGCTPVAAQLSVIVSCTTAGAFELLKALAFIYIPNQLTYLAYHPNQGLPTAPATG